MIKTQSKDVIVSLRLTERDKERLELIADYKGVSQSELMRQIINNSYRQIRHRKDFKSNG